MHAEEKKISAASDPGSFDPQSSALINRPPAIPKEICQKREELSCLCEDRQYMYINKMGGAPSRDLCQLALRMWNWCIDCHLSRTSTRFTESSSVDRESSSKTDSSKWALDSHTFDQLMDKRGPCTVDPFASRLSAKHPTYYSWRSDPGATAVNALCQHWGTSIGYAFLPFCMKAGDWPRSPRKILITSLWKSQAWFPLILRMSVEIPLLVQSHKKILTDPLGNSHPMVLQGHLQLVAWTVSGVHSQD